jgi:hypothetical protein
MFVSKIFMEQSAVICCLTPKSLCAFAIAVEIKWVYETKVLALSPVKK